MKTQTYIQLFCCYLWFLRINISTFAAGLTSSWGTCWWSFASSWTGQSACSGRRIKPRQIHWQCCRETCTSQLQEGGVQPLQPITLKTCYISCRCCRSKHNSTHLNGEGKRRRKNRFRQWADEPGARCIINPKKRLWINNERMIRGFVLHVQLEKNWTFPLFSSVFMLKFRTKAVTLSRVREGSGEVVNGKAINK